MRNKIFTQKSIKKEIKKQKLKNKTIVLCHGVFDLLHLGHIKHFESAKTKGDFLIVSITSDKYVNKGPGRPLFNKDIRANTISALSIVDAVIISNFETSEEIIKIIKPDIYFKGPDYKNNKKDLSKNIYKEIKAVKKYNGKIIYSNDETYSSSNLINNSGILFNDEQKKFLNSIKKKYSFDYILKTFEKFNFLKPLIIGETIIDEYIFCDVLGKSGKEPHLVIKDEFVESYLGGAGAIANHLSSFCKKINFLTCIGDQNNHVNFIKKSIKKNINSKIIIKKNSPTILKKRFLDIVSRNKLFGVYSMNDQLVDSKTTQNIYNNIKNNFLGSDLLIISDYGHGFISDKLAKDISKLNKFTALNAQVNASNYGYHSLNKYKKIDSLIINETELRHEVRDKRTDVYALSKILKKKYKINNLIVTRGRNGALLIGNEKNKIIQCPAFTEKVIDKVGAGDTMLSIISLCLKLKIPGELSLLIGSLAGANSVESIANSQTLDKKNLLRKIEYILK